MNSTSPPEISISEADFSAFVQQQLNWIKLQLEDKPDSIMPHLAVKTINMEGEDSLTLCAIATDFNTPEEKKTVLMGIARKIYEEKQIPVAVALSCEAWVAANPPKNTAPSQCSNRRECIIVAAQNFRGDMVKLITIPVSRDAENGMTASEEEGMTGENRDVQSPILTHFYRGYYEAAMAYKTNN